MKLARILGVIVFAVMLALPWHGIEAGGWASVEIVNNPDLIEAGKPVHLDLSIKQHGINPVDIDPLVISATNPNTGDAIEETATKGEGEGNYTIELTFPTDGVWDLMGTPGSFPPFDMGSVKVGQTLGAASLAAPAGSIVISITGGMGSGRFDPGRVEIPAGTLVVWQNDSVEGHTVVIDDGIERSGLIGPGGAYAMVFDKPGEYRYSCGPHPAMKGAIVVE